MKNGNEKGDIYGIILFHTYETLIQDTFIDPTTNTEGCKALASTLTLPNYSHIKIRSHEDHIEKHIVEID